MSTLAPTSEIWRCYFETADGLVLAAREQFADPEAAASWGAVILQNAAQFELEDPDGELVPATMVDAGAGLTVEPEED